VLPERHDQKVVRDVARGALDDLMVEVDIAIPLRPFSTRRGIVRQDPARGDVIQHRRKEVLVVLVDDCHAHLPPRQIGERRRRRQAAKSSTQDDDVLPGGV
jgi:hypothetical protein